MSQYNQITKKISIPTGGTALRIWDAPHGAPVKNITILVRASGIDISKITQEVFLGGYFTNASSQVVEPYSEDSLHKGGVSQGAAAALGTGTLCVDVIYTDTGLFPANIPSSPGGILMPLAVEFKNTNTVAANIEVTFISETLNSTV